MKSALQLVFKLKRHRTATQTINSFLLIPVAKRGERFDSFQISSAPISRTDVCCYHFEASARDKDSTSRGLDQRFSSLPKLNISLVVVVVVVAVLLLVVVVDVANDPNRSFLHSASFSMSSSFDIRANLLLCLHICVFHKCVAIIGEVS